MNLYEQLSQRILGLIEQGALRPGDRVPSVRKLSQEQGVSVSTVLQAYLQLEDSGWIEARPQSGYYVRAQALSRPPEPQKSKAPCQAKQVRICELVSNVFQEARRADTLNLGAACPSPELFPNAKFHRTLSGIARRRGADCNTYDFPPGYEGLRREIARRSLSFGCSLSPSEVVTTTGAMEALNLCLRAVAGPGDNIAIETPSYYGTLQAIESLGMKAIEIPTDPRDGICLDALELALKKHRVKAVVSMPNFLNPTGSLMPDENKRRLVQLITRHEVPLIEDDVHGDLYFEGGRPKVAKAFDSENWVLLVSSFSKTLAPGHRVGWVAPGRFQARVERLKFISTVATATLPQMAIADFLKNGGYDHHLRGLRRAFSMQMHQATAAVCRYFPEGTKMTRPKGGFVLWIELPKGVDSLELHRRAMREKISICPGPIFSATQAYSNFIRISCGEPWTDRIDAGFSKLGDLAKKAAR